LGGAALSTVVSAADANGDYLDMLHGQLHAERQSVSKLLAENESLRIHLEQVKLELRLERQNKFRAGCDDHEAVDVAIVGTPPDEANPASACPRKRGAPVGHPGWFRATPTQVDRTIDVPAPELCPHCGGVVHLFPAMEPREHVQEDIVDHVYQVVLYRHAAARCGGCGNGCSKPVKAECCASSGHSCGPGRLFLRNDIGMSYRKIPRALRNYSTFALPRGVDRFREIAGRRR
jgi:hypothetical protein